MACGGLPPADGDCDGVPDEDDNCPELPNPDQADFDNDGLGNACDDDIDDDGVSNDFDACSYSPSGALIILDEMDPRNGTVPYGDLDGDCDVDLKDYQLMEAILRHRRVSKSQAREQSITLLEKTGITGAASRLGQYPHQLSGGLRQRVMIAMALICEPELLIADEPTTALDVTIQAQILNQLARLQHEFHMAMILITHDLGVVARIVNRLIVMYAGKIVETGSTQDIFENPMHPYTQGLLTCIPVPGKTERGAHLGTIAGIVPTLIGEISGCGYFNRCPLAQKNCAVENPDFKIMAPGRGYRCTLESERLKKQRIYDPKG